ncbi:hypothetical protein AAHB34_06235 [Paenarthrobacter ureafaciens]
MPPCNAPAISLQISIAWSMEGQLGEVHLNTLTEEQTKQVLGSVLGHYVSSTLVGSLHSAVGGNPMLLHALLDEQRHSGNLVLNDSVWTLRDRIKLEGATVVEDFVRSRLAREPQTNRTVIEIPGVCAARNLGGPRSDFQHRDPGGDGRIRLPDNRPGR